MRVMITYDGIRIADGWTAVKLEMRRGRKLIKEFTELKNLRICMKIREPSFSFSVPLSGSWFYCSFGEE